jgi:cell division GTPase FtsZ
LSAGGGGGNILRSLKRLFRRDLVVAQKTNPKFAARLDRSVVTRFLDTNAFSLADVPKEERLLIGPETTGRLGSMHNPAVAKQALDESQSEVAALLEKYAVIVLMGTGGKGTGAGTMLPLAKMARQMRKLVIPVFVRPSFERHEVEKPRYDHALRVVQGFDAAGIRLIEILNDYGYVERDPQPQSVVWERMNLPIARALRGLLYVLSDLSQVDPSDLSLLFAGRGRLRIGFSEIDPLPGKDPADEQIQKAVAGCWENPYCAFEKPVGSSLICIQGDWSNVVDGKIKSRLATLAVDGAAESTYNPLYARAFHAPRPWGVSAIFSEYTGQQQPLEIEWPSEHRPTPRTAERDVLPRVHHVAAADPSRAVEPDDVDLEEEEDVEDRPSAEAAPDMTASFTRFWDLAFALQRSEPSALAFASGSDGSEVTIDSADLRKLLGTMWFPSVFQHLSAQWKDRLLDTLVEDVVVPNHMVRVGRRTLPVSEVSLEDVREVVRKTILPDTTHADLQLLVTVGHLWGPQAVRRLRFGDAADASHHSKLGLLLQAWRHG